MILYGILAAAIVAGDQLVKWWAVKALGPGGSWDVLPGIFIHVDRFGWAHVPPAFREWCAYRESVLFHRHLFASFSSSMTALRFSAS